ncbi:MAG: HAD-IA family hydrolase [Alphaproteobacteria bacterium]
MSTDLHELLKDHDIISFDIFDTLLIRPYLSPDHLFLHMERFTDRKGFAEARKIAEWKARKNASKEDVTLDEIYLYLPKEYQGAKQTELDFEETFLAQNPEIFSIYQEALKLNKKIIIVSDMYLPKATLEKILRKNGYTAWDKFYLSNEEGVAKYSGNLYKRVLNDLNVNPKKILHIGDHKVSDVLQAQKVGLDTYQVLKNSDQFFKKHKRLKKVYKEHPNSLEISLILTTLVEKWIKEKKNFFESKEYWSDFAYCLGGPIGYGFNTFITQKINPKDLPNLLFIARDGYTLKRIFEAVNSHQKGMCFYVYAQRMLRARMLLNWDNEDSADLVLSCLREKIGKLPHFNNYSEKDSFLKKNISILAKDAEQKQKEYLDYLIKLGISPEKETYIIDSGAATFSAQLLLEKVLHQKTTGIYTIAYKDNAQKMGISYSSWSDGFEKIGCITAIVEFILMAPEPPISDLVQGKPVYQKPTIEEYQRNKLTKTISDNVVNFSKDISNRLSKYPIVFSANEINTYLKSFYQYFSKKDKKILDCIYCPSTALNDIYKKTLFQQIMSYLKKKKRVYFLGIKLIQVEKYGQKTLWHFLGLPLINYSRETSKEFVKLFSIIPLLKIQEKRGKKYIYLFNLFKIIKIS